MELIYCVVTDNEYTTIPFQLTGFLNLPFTCILIQANPPQQALPVSKHPQGSVHHYRPHTALSLSSQGQDTSQKHFTVLLHWQQKLHIPHNPGNESFQSCFFYDFIFFLIIKVTHINSRKLGIFRNIFKWKFKYPIISLSKNNNSKFWYISFQYCFKLVQFGSCKVISCYIF